MLIGQAPTQITGSQCVCDRHITAESVQITWNGRKIPDQGFPLRITCVIVLEQPRQRLNRGSELNQKRPTIGAVVYFAICFALGVYFTFAAVQGDYGLFQRVQFEAEAQALRGEMAEMQNRVAALDNKTRRLSDDYLDLDLLDEQARQILGLVRHNEIVIH